MSEVSAGHAADERFGWLRPIVARAIQLGRRRRVQRALALALFTVSIGGVAALIVTHMDQLRAAPWRLDPIRLALGLLFQASTVVIASWMWSDLSYRLGADWNPRRDVRAYAYALVAKRLPGAFWHVLGRAAYYGDAGLGRRVGIMGSALEAGLLVLTGTGLALIAFREIQPYGLFGGLLLLGGGPAVFRPAMHVLLRGQTGWLPPLSRLYLWTLVDIAAWLLGASGVYFLFDALYPLGLDLWLDVLAATTISIVGSAAVLVLPGGLGLRELGMTGVLGQTIPAGIAAALAIAFRISISLIEVAWSLLIILLVRPSEQAAGSE